MADDRNAEMGGRRYNDDEVRRLLERASQARATGTSIAATRGLTLEQLEDVAAEAGIDVAMLRQAARELDAERARQPAGPAERLAGAPFRSSVEQTLPFEIDDDMIASLVDSISTSADEVGEARLIGRTLSWTASTNSGRRLEIRISARSGETHVRVDERYGELAGGLFGGTIGGVGGGAGIGGGAAVASLTGVTALGFAVPAVLIAGSWAACRFGYRAYVNRRGTRLDEICDRIVQDIRAAGRSD